MREEIFPSVPIMSGLSGFRSGVLKTFLNKLRVPELAYSRRDLFAMRFEREVSGVEEADHRLRHVSFERLGTGRQKERVVPAPRRQKRRLVLTKVFLE